MGTGKGKGWGKGTGRGKGRGVAGIVGEFTFQWKKISRFPRIGDSLSPEKVMDDEFKIFVEQLREGRERKISETLDPAFLDIDEPDLAFEKPVELEGVAYLAENELVLHWDVKAEALISCCICNEKVAVPLHVQNFYYSEPMDEIKSGVYNFKELLRETILIEVPLFVECNGGNCPLRKEYADYLKNPSDSQPDQEEGYHPFADLDWKP